MHVLIAHNDYGRPSGEEHAVEAAATVLKDNGHEVSWLRKSSARLQGSLSGQVGAFFSGIHSFRAASEIAALLAEGGVDLLHVQNVYPLLSPSILRVARAHGVPVVMRCPNYRLFCPTGLHLHKNEICIRCASGREWWCIVQNCEANYGKSLGYALRSGFARISGAFANNVTKFVVLSEFQRQRFVEGGIPESKLEILPNFVDLPPPFSSVEVGTTIGFLGRPAKEKGIDVFIKAAERLPECRFAVAGDPASMPALEGPTPDNVSFRGFLSGSELDRFCREIRIMVAPSNWFEGFPNAIARAMSYGKPVICSRIGALPEVVIDGVTGLLHEPNSVDELVACIKKLHRSDDACRSLGKAGRERARRHYSRDRFYKRLMSIYSSALHASHESRLSSSLG